MQTATEQRSAPGKKPALTAHFMQDAAALIERKWPRLHMAIHYHRSTSGLHMSFTNREWLRAIYKDNSPHIVGMKASQTYMSEWAVCDLFTLAKKGLRGMYVLDSDARRSTFVADRIDKMTDYSIEYRQAIKKTKGEADSRVLKTIYGKAMKFIGSRAKGAFYEYACDVIWIDEYDLHDEAALVYAEDRIKNSIQKHTRKFGNPTVEGRGIAAQFLLSDQKWWRVPCEHCQTVHVLDWEKHFVEDMGAGVFELRDKAWETEGLSEPRPICDSCDKPFNRLNKGHWQADNPDSTISGYQISQLFIHVEDDDIAQHWDKFKKAQNNATALQHFNNNILGIPYSMSMAKLSEFDLDACCNRNGQSVKLRSLGPQLRMVAGIDQGRVFHLIISEIVDGTLVDRFVGTAGSWPEVKSILDAHNVVCAVVDAQGGGYAETRQFVEGREGAYMCRYVPKDRIKLPYNLDEETGVVEANRTEWCDISTGLIKARKIVLLSDYASVDDGQYKEQMLVPTRILDPGGRPIWTKGNDHYFHANVYRTLAHEISGMNNSIRTKKSWSVS